MTSIRLATWLCQVILIYLKAIFHNHTFATVVLLSYSLTRSFRVSFVTLCCSFSFIDLLPINMNLFATLPHTLLWDWIYGKSTANTLIARTKHWARQIWFELLWMCLFQLVHLIGRRNTVPSPLGQHFVSKLADNILFTIHLYYEFDVNVQYISFVGNMSIEIQIRKPFRCWKHEIKSISVWGNHSDRRKGYLKYVHFALFTNQSKWFKTFWEHSQFQ